LFSFFQDIMFNVFRFVFRFFLEEIKWFFFPLFNLKKN